MWAASDDQRARIKQAALELAPGEMLASVTVQGAELEGITAVLLLTDEDDFNALAAAIMAGNAETQVYRLAARHPSHGVIAPYTGGETVCAPTLTRYEVGQRHGAGARITTAPADAPIPDGTDILFLIRPDGRLVPVTISRPPAPMPGDTLVLLGPASAPVRQQPATTQRAG
jgi:hypothetical protein